MLVAPAKDAGYLRKIVRVRDQYGIAQSNKKAIWPVFSGVSRRQGSGLYPECSLTYNVTDSNTGAPDVNIALSKSQP